VGEKESPVKSGTRPATCKKEKRTTFGDEQQEGKPIEKNRRGEHDLGGRLSTSRKSGRSGISQHLVRLDARE